MTASGETSSMRAINSQQKLFTLIYRIKKKKTKEAKKRKEEKKESLQIPKTEEPLNMKGIGLFKPTPKPLRPSLFPYHTQILDMLTLYPT